MSKRQIDGEIERIRQIYCCDVVQDRNRVVRLPGRKCEPQILETLLGYELKAGRRRINCPDVVSARYLKIFAELGFKDVFIPYDPTRTEIMVSGLEGALDKIKELLEGSEGDTRRRNAALRRIYGRIRQVCRCDQN